ncbi:MAG TPA: exosortase/archaeosortase family protein [Pirellulaceae bacterium]|nr:exosortase/archaeosortase family protein [Pirellulaceae bacterium]
MKTRRKKNVSDSRNESPAARQRGADIEPAQLAPTLPLATPAARGALAAIAALVGVGLWAYWPTLSELFATWSREPDYSHGFLVVPLATYFLWARRKEFPGVYRGSWLLGLGLIGLSLAMRCVAAKYFFSFLDGWSILFWLSGVVVALGGLPLLKWSLPAIAFLWFMVPLPFSTEGLLSQPLQRVATKVSVFFLQTLGQPAIAEGNVIILEEIKLEVAQACSGLRLFVSIFALAFACVVIVRKSWLETLILLASAVPIAVLANAGRIVATGVFLPLFTSESARHLVHDAAGWSTIPVAAAMFGFVVWYLGQVLIEEHEVDMSSVVRQIEIQPRTRPTPSTP